MTTVAPTINRPVSGRAGGFLVQWPAMANGQTGVPFDLSGYVPVSVQIEGTFGAAGSVTLQETIDGTNYETAHDGQGNALTFTTAGLKSVGDNANLIRPNVTAGDGTTALTVSLWVRTAPAR
jgi:hypothetical protein